MKKGILNFCKIGLLLSENLKVNQTSKKSKITSSSVSKSKQVHPSHE